MGNSLSSRPPYWKTDRNTILTEAERMPASVASDRSNRYTLCALTRTGNPNCTRPVGEGICLIQGYDMLSRRIH